MEFALIGVDLGTTTCKSIVFDDKLNILGEAYVEYPLINISAEEIEQDAVKWWELVRETIKNAMKQANIAGESVKGVSVSAQGISFVPVDKRLKPLRNALSWLDTRAKAQNDRFMRKFGEMRIFSMTGKRANEAYVLPKLLWIRDEEPDIYEKTYKFLMAQDFITAMMCGECVTDHTMASGTLAYDNTDRRWSMPILKGMGVDADKLPAIRYSGSAVGVMDARVSRELGLGRDVTVSTGGQDQKCAALGAGVDQDTATVSLGTAVAITQKCCKPVIDAQMRVPCFTDVTRDNWVIEGSIGAGCASLKWLKETLFPDRSYKELDIMADKCGNGKDSIFFYPYLAGAGAPYWYKTAKGAFYGITLATDASSIVRSVLEGIAYHIGYNLDVMHELYRSVEKLKIFGGGAKSDVWCQLISDVTNKEVSTLSSHETACTGAAILAGTGCGVYGDVDMALKYCRINKSFRPREQFVNLHGERRKEYIKIQQKLFA